jgi:hypothetical protein
MSVIREIERREGTYDRVRGLIETTSASANAATRYAASSARAAATLVLPAGGASLRDNVRPLARPCVVWPALGLTSHRVPVPACLVLTLVLVLVREICECKDTRDTRDTSSSSVTDRWSQMRSPLVSG